MKDYSLQIKVRNNYLLTVMRREGCETAADVARRTGVQQSHIGLLLNLKESAVTSRGWRGYVLRIAEGLRCMPEDIVPPQHYESALAKNTAETEVDASEIQGFLAQIRDPEAELIQNEAVARLTKALSHLQPRERDVIERRFGFNGEAETLEQVGNVHGVCRERINQIEAKALRKLRNPAFHLSGKMVEDIAT